MKYMLWSDKSIEAIKNSKEMRIADKIANGIGRELIGIIEEANQRHNEAMLIKDIEIAKLETKIKLLREL